MTAEIKVLHFAEGTPVDPPTTLTPVFFEIEGSVASPVIVDPAVGIVFSGEFFYNVKFVKSNGGADVISANPQISAGEVIGQRLLLRYVSDTDTLELSDGNGLDLPGTFISENKRQQELWWDGSLWSELFRR